MEEIVLKIKNKSKLKFLTQLLEQFDFVEMKKTKEAKKSTHNFFDSAGIWEGRDIDSHRLRDEAWTRK
jgi:hypothetical protein